MTALGYSLIPLLLTALLAYLADRFQSRRAVVADALVAALTNALRPTFLVDLAIPDHSMLVTKPVQHWRSFVASLQPPVELTDEQVADKVDEVLTWRMAERQERIRFAAVARARDVRHLADYYAELIDAAGKRGEKIRVQLSQEVDAVNIDLVRTVASVRLPTLARPLHAAFKRIPGLGRLLVSDDDLRILLADYSLTRPAPSRHPTGAIRASHTD